MHYDNSSKTTNKLTKQQNFDSVSFNKFNSSFISFRSPLFVLLYFDMEKQPFKLLCTVAKNLLLSLATESSLHILAGKILANFSTVLHCICSSLHSLSTSSLSTLEGKLSAMLIASLFVSVVEKIQISSLICQVFPQTMIGSNQVDKSFATQHYLTPDVIQ